MSLKSINKIIKNKQSITFDTAQLLSKVFGQSPQYWINLDTNYRLRSKSEIKHEKDVEAKTIIYKYMPVNEIIKKGWIKKYSTIKELKNEVKKFWNREDLDFSFLDEIAHILLHLKNKDDYFLDNFDEINTQEEEEANDLALKILKTKEILSHFKQFRRYISKVNVMSYSEELKLNPGIIVGFLQFNNMLSWRSMNRFKVSLKGQIDEKYYIEENLKNSTI